MPSNIPPDRHRSLSLRTASALNPAQYEHVGQGEMLQSSKEIEVPTQKCTIEKNRKDYLLNQKSISTPLSKQQTKVLSKSKPRSSKQGKADIVLNCEVKVLAYAGTSEPNPELIECRHLALKFAKAVGKKSALMLQFSTEHGIAEQFRGQWNKVNEEFIRLILHAPQDCKHLVSDDNLGHYLKALTQALKDKATTDTKASDEVNCLLLSINHVMALHVQRKCKEGINYFAVKLYDPNDTATYRRVVQLEPLGFENFKLQDLLNKPNNVDFYAGGKSQPLAMVALSLDFASSLPIERQSAKPTAQNMQVALAYGAYEAMSTLLSQPDLSLDELFLLLEAKSLKLQDPGLSVTCQNGHTRTAEVYFKAVLESGLSNHLKVALLGAKRSNGDAGLFKAFQEGHTSLVEAYVKAILESSLDDDQKVELLAAKDSNGTPGLFMALQEGRTSLVEAYVKAILESSLDDDQKVELLAAKDIDGDPGLFMALQEGNSNTVVAYGKAILESSLDDDQKAELLSAKCSNNDPGLCMALNEGHTSTVEAYVKIILESSLSQHQKIELLVATSSLGTSGLSIAIQGGHSSTVRAYLKGIEGSEIENQIWTQI